MAKSFKEFLGLPTVRVGGLDSMHPIADLGDTPPKCQGSIASRATGLQANYSSQAPGTMRPFLKAQQNTVLNKIKSKYNLTKDQLADLTRLPMTTLTSILNSAGALAQYLPMGEETELEKYFDNIEKGETKK